MNKIIQKNFNRLKLNHTEPTKQSNWPIHLHLGALPPFIQTPERKERFSGRFFIINAEETEKYFSVCRGQGCAENTM